MNFGDILSQWEKDPQNPRVVRKEELSGNGVAGDLLAGPVSISPKRLPHQAAIDLHGKTKEETVEALGRFILSCKTRGFRKVLIIHGKGLHSDSEGVLQKTVQDFIATDPRLGAWGHPGIKDGGSGATWVLIK
jgi:DNA-nicking Smr family endonuclease